jgi:hypothetical protein
MRSEDRRWKMEDGTVLSVSVPFSIPYPPSSLENK